MSLRIPRKRQRKPYGRTGLGHQSDNRAVILSESFSGTTHIFHLRPIFGHQYDRLQTNICFRAADLYPPPSRTQVRILVNSRLFDQVTDGKKQRGLRFTIISVSVMLKTPDFDGVLALVGKTSAPHTRYILFTSLSVIQMRFFKVKKLVKMVSPQF